jgi:hypothetical protein
MPTRRNKRKRHPSVGKKGLPPTRESERPSWGSSLYTLYFIDETARLRADLVAVCVGFLCALVTGIAYDGSDARVVAVAVTGMLAVKLGHTLWYCYANSVMLESGTPSRHEEARLPSWFWRYSVPVCVAAVAALVLPGGITGHFTGALLTATDIGLLPGTVSAAPKPLAARFESETNALQQLLAEKKQGDPGEIEKVRKRMEQVVQTLHLPNATRNNAIDEIVHLQGYETFSTISGSPRPSILEGAGNGTRTVTVAGAAVGFMVKTPWILEDAGVYSNGLFQQNVAIQIGSPGVPALVIRTTIDGLTQKLDGITWIDVTFKHCIIIYDGGPVYMTKVKFIDCEFRISPTHQNLIDYLQKSGPTGVTFYQPSN